MATRINPYSTLNMPPWAGRRAVNPMTMGNNINDAVDALYTPSPMEMAGTNLNVNNQLYNELLHNEYRAQRPGKTAISNIFGTSDGYRPLGVVDNVADEVVEGAVAAKRAGNIQKADTLKGFFGKNFSWNKKSGLQAFGKNAGKVSNIAGGVIQGAQALMGANKLSKTRENIDDTIDDIMLSYASNPYAGNYLTAEQKKLLHELDKDRYSRGASFGDFMPNSIGDVARPMVGAGLGFLTGGVPGAIINGVGGHVNEGFTNANESQQQKAAELEALLNTLQQAELEQQNLQRMRSQRMMYANSMY